MLRGGSGEGDAGWALVFDRHSIGFRSAGRVVSAQLIGSGVRSIFGPVSYTHLTLPTKA